MNEILNHLLQSTLFAAAVGAANTTLRRNSPRLRYWLWLAASAKFLVPFSLLVSTGARIQFPPDSPSLHAVTVQQISTYFAPFPAFSTPAPATATFRLPQTLAAIWVAGALFLVFRWFRRWRMIHSAVRRATHLPLGISVPARSSASMTEPGVFGVFMQVLLLPEGIADTLTPEQFDAILAHELRHIRYRDNLTAALHMWVETLFWFHPLVWWIGAQLMAERERDCDEAVLMQGSQPGDYARGIVHVCEAYLESPLACASGIGGSDLKKRIREIMTWRRSLPVTLRAKALLAAATFAAVSIPFAIGILRAQTLPPAPAYTYEAVSVHKSESECPPCGIESGPQGGLRTTNTPVMLLLTFAYGVRDYQFSGAPRWVSSDHYDIVFTPDKAEAPLGPDPTLDAGVAAQSRNKQRLQAVLRDRFGLVLRAETHELPIYLLTQAKSGLKLTVHPEGKPGHYIRATDGGYPRHIEAVGISIKTLADNLSNTVGRPVTDGSGLTGQYDFKLDWTPDPGSSPNQPDDIGPSIFAALTDQLGLRLQSTKGPVQVYVIEKIEHPSEN
jgi:bla regulator protein blaR1